ncbi:MAG: DUF6438 domain-containing protein [Vicinamibacterales bacterium]
MGRLTALALVALAAIQRPATIPFTDAELASATIIMSRENRCSFFQESPTDIRQCPTYSVGLFGDGRVTYIGSSGVGMIGTLTHKVSTAAARALVEEFIRAKFFAFDESYRSIDFGRYIQSIDHSVGTTLTLSVGNQSKSVYTFYGIPNALLELQRRVEDVTDVRRYTGRPPPDAGPFTLAGQVTDTNGSPIAGALITIPGAVSYESTTDGAGRYQVPAATVAGLVACVVEAQQQARPAWAVVQRHGFKSLVAQGIFTGSRGEMWFYTFENSPCGSVACKPRFVAAPCDTPVVSTLPTGGAAIVCEIRKTP